MGTRGSAPRPLVVALWILGGILMGLVWTYPQIASYFRQRGGPYAEMRGGCQPVNRLCSAKFADGTEVRFGVQPSRHRAKRKFRFSVEASNPPKSVELTSTNMNIGLFHIPLKPEGPGTWTATTYLPLCTMDRMAWRAEVVFQDRSAAFTFESDQK